MHNFFLEKIFTEHHGYPNGEEITIHKDSVQAIYFKGNFSCSCVDIKHSFNQSYLHTSYYIGVDWVTTDKAIYVEPKYIGSDKKTDYFAMLFQAIQHLDEPLDDLFEIKFNQPPIEIDQSQDLLTPLLVTHFLNLMKKLVHKGLKKSYYTVEQNLTSRVKGKVLVGQTIKKNIVQNKVLQTMCRYEEFGLNSLENRLLKKALLFVQRYLPAFTKLSSEKDSIDLFNYIMPAFAAVSDEVEIQHIKHFKANSFYKEYTEAIHLAKLILKRYGYNINHVQNSKKISTPPFWIDMSKLFELYVLSLLRNAYGKELLYHPSTYGNELDFLLTKKGSEMVIDAKYKPLYQDRINHDDIRQVSGYARLETIYSKLQKDTTELIDCLIIYPDPINTSFIGFDTIDIKSNAEKIKQYAGIYKIGIPLPVK